jgi:hypothetical protein
MLKRLCQGTLRTALSVWRTQRRSLARDPFVIRYRDYHVLISTFSARRVGRINVESLARTVFGSDRK